MVPLVSQTSHWRDSSRPKLRARPLSWLPSLRRHSRTEHNLRLMLGPGMQVLSTRRGMCKGMLFTRQLPQLENSAVAFAWWLRKRSDWATKDRCADPVVAPKTSRARSMLNRLWGRL